MVCSRCGTPAEPEEVFCGSCGARLGQPIRSAPDPVTDRVPGVRRFPLILAGIAVVAAALIGFAVLSPRREASQAPLNALPGSDRGELAPEEEQRPLPTAASSNPDAVPLPQDPVWQPSEAPPAQPIPENPVWQPPPAAAVPQPAASAAMRLLRVRGVRCEHNVPIGDQPAMRVSIEVETLGMEGKPIQLEVRLRTEDGVFLGTAPGTPAEYGDNLGFRTGAQARIQYAAAVWSASVPVPYGAVAAPANPYQPVIVSALASCDGFFSVSETEMSLSPAGTTPPRAVRVLGTRLLQGGTLPGQPQVPATLVTGTVEAEGLLGANLTVALRLRQLDGTPVASSSAGPPYADPSGRFVSSSGDSVRSPAARWPSFYAYIPYSALALQPAGQQRLILTYTAMAGPLGAYSEEDFIVNGPMP
jgi:hypothetical protein